jgi:hypothetical protein
MENALHIRRASRRLRIGFTVILILIPIICALVWFFINDMSVDMQEAMKLPRYVRFPLPVWARVAGFVVSTLPAFVAMYGIAVLIRLFRLYEMGQIFRPANVRCFRSLSRVLAGWCAANIAAGPLMSLGLTLHHPPGQRMISIALGSPDITAILVGFVLAVIAWVMEEGCKLQEEQDFTV